MGKQGRIFGYARVSSTEQNLDRQLQALSEYVSSENIITDKQSGKDLNRPGYQALKGHLGLRSGDILYIMSLDRLSRSKGDIKVPEGQEWITEMINNILIEVLSSMAEQERLTIRKRQRQGIEAAKTKGKHLGRPYNELPKNATVIIAQWFNKEIGTKAACDMLGISKTTFYRLLKRQGK